MQFIHEIAIIFLCLKGSDKMKIKNLLFAIMLFPLSSALVQDKELAYLYDFLQGQYQVVGREPDSDRTYTGTVILRKEHGQLKLIRKINGKVIEGVGKVETVTADEIKVLRVRFVQSEKKYEITYLIHSDLDNYARLSGHVYLQDGKTKRAGLETLFIDHR